MIEGVNEMLDAILLPIGEGNRILSQISAGKIDELIAQTYPGRSREDESRRQQRGRRVQNYAKEVRSIDARVPPGATLERGKAAELAGAYAAIVTGINEMLDAILLPIGEGNRILAQMSRRARLMSSFDCTDLSRR